MKAKHLLPFAALALPLFLSAKPAYKGVLTHQNPDGSVVEFRLHGDEHFNYITDTDGMLMKRADNGAFVYELINGQRIKADAEIVANMLQANRDSNPGMMKAPSKMAALNSQGRTTYPTNGEVHSLVVLMEYSDTKFQPTSPAEIEKMLNEEGYNNFGSNGSARDYYIYNSNGKFKPTFDVSRVVSLPKTSAYYTGRNRYEFFYEAIKYALDELDSEIDFSKYDYDNDGIVDNIYFFYAGYGAADTDLYTVVWPHQSSLINRGWSYDGKKIATYACSNELNGQMHWVNKDLYLDGPGTFVHEFGHVLGMPDLYDPNYSNTSITPGNWDVMDDGSYNNEGYCPPNLSAYEKWVYNWIDYTIAEDGTHYDILPVTMEGGQAIRVPVIRPNGTPYDTEYFILESRDKKNWDAYINDYGMLIWHIQFNNSDWTMNRVNSVLNQPRCYIVAADGTSNPFLRAYGYPRYATFGGEKSGISYLAPSTTVNLQAYATSVIANPLDVYITGIKFDPETSVTSFDYNIVREGNSETTTMLSPKRTGNASGQATAGFVVEWEPVEGADGYLVSIFREGSTGNRSYEAGYNEKNVGTATSVAISGLTSTKMKAEYHAYVRVMKGLPSTEISNEIVFVPNNITEVSGVETVVGDVENAPIYGVTGAVVAPEGAEVYSLTGVKVAKSELAPGIYIVRYGNRVEKVTVR